MAENAAAPYLNGSTQDFINITSVDLLDRWTAHSEWWNERLEKGADPYAKFTDGFIRPTLKAHLRDGTPFEGINFASQDYLGLSAHPEVMQAAHAAIDRYGVHSAGSATLMGNTRLSRTLEERLAEFTGYADCTVFPTGWGAGYSAVKMLTRPNDHIVIDGLAHACLREGAVNATKNVHSVPHLSNVGIERQLKRIRADEANAGILVVTETLFSMDSDVPNLHELKAICTRYNATLLVDVAHDFGAIGPRGLGHLELQDALGIPDVLMGSFSKTFASNGGFIASNHPGLKTALRFNASPLTFTNAISPVQAAIVLKALDIVQSDEGAERRERMLANSRRLRQVLQLRGFEVMGEPSAILPVILGNSALSRMATKFALELGAIVNLVEYPAVSRNTCRWRLQVTADHETAQLDRFAGIAAEARRMAEEMFSEVEGQDEHVEVVAAE